MSLIKDNLLVVNVENLVDGCKATFTIKESAPDDVLINAEHGRYKLEDLKEAIKANRKNMTKRSINSTPATLCESIFRKAFNSYIFCTPGHAPLTLSSWCDSACRVPTQYNHAQDD